MEKTTLHLRKDDREYIREIQQLKKNLPVADALHLIVVEHKQMSKGLSVIHGFLNSLKFLNDKLRG